MTPRHVFYFTASSLVGAFIDRSMSALRALSLTNTFRQLFGRIETNDHRRRRQIGILQGIVTSLGNRFVGLLVNFLSVPLTIGYLGPERYGAWVTLGSLLAWLSLMDLGLHGGLTNAITSAVSQERPDLARTHLSNGVFLLSLSAMTIGLAAYLIWPFVGWGAIFGLSSEKAQTEIGPAVAAALLIFLMQVPLTVSGKVYLAHQEGKIGNYWGAAGNVLSLLALLIVTRTQGGLPWLVIAVSGTSMLVNFASTLWLFSYYKPLLSPRLRHINFSMMRSVMHVGGQFFLIQIMALVTFQTDNFFVSHYLGAARVPEYSLTYSLFNYTSLPQNLLFSYLWTAYAEAITRNDIAWVKKTLHLNLVIGVAFTVVMTAGLAFIAKPFIGWWGGPTVAPSSALIAWMAAWSVINAYTNPIACMLAAASHLREQIRYAAIATVSNVFLSFFLVQHVGVHGVIAATVISYAIFVCVPVYIDVNALLKRLEHAV